LFAQRGESIWPAGITRRNSACRPAHYALPNRHLEALGLFSLKAVEISDMGCSASRFR